MLDHLFEGTRVTRSTSQMALDALLKMPDVSRWASAQRTPPAVSNPVEFHLWTLVRALKASDTMRCRIWTDSVMLLTSGKTSILTQILETDELVNSLGPSLTDIYTPLAELAILTGEGSRAFPALQRLADLSGLAAFRFLAAWTAFNDNLLPLCIAECEKTTEPFAPIHTLLGQALLESGHISDAIDALKVSARLAPSDPLPRVQLIKAYLVKSNPEDALPVINECRKILGLNIEIECLAAMAILSSSHPQVDFAERTISQISKHLLDQPTDFEAFSLATEVALKTAQKEWSRKLVQILNISEQTSFKTVTTKLPVLLKGLNELGWYDIATTLIDKTLAVTRQSQTGFNRKIAFTQ
jgi:hypothetical protein